MNSGVGYSLPSPIIGNVTTNVTLGEISVRSTTNVSLLNPPYFQVCLDRRNVFHQGLTWYTTSYNASSGSYSYTATADHTLTSASYMHAEMDGVMASAYLPPAPMNASSVVMQTGIDPLMYPGQVVPDGTYEVWQQGSGLPSKAEDAFSPGKTWRTSIALWSWGSQNAWLHSSPEINGFRGCCITMSLPAQVAYIDSIEMTSTTAFASGNLRGPKRFVLFGSNDNITWNTLYYTPSDVNWTDTLTARTFNLTPSSIAYSYLNLMITDIDGEQLNLGRYLSLSNLRFKVSYKPRFSPNVTNVPCLTSSGNTPLSVTTKYRASDISRTLLLNPSAILSVATPSGSIQQPTLGRTLLSMAAILLCNPGRQLRNVNEVFPDESMTSISSIINDSIRSWLKSALESIQIRQAVLDYVYDVAADMLCDDTETKNVLYMDDGLPKFNISTTLNLTLQYTRFGQAKSLIVAVPIMFWMD